MPITKSGTLPSSWPFDAVIAITNNSMNFQKTDWCCHHNDNNQQQTYQPQCTCHKVSQNNATNGDRIYHQQSAKPANTVIKTWQQPMILHFPLFAQWDPQMLQLNGWCCHRNDNNQQQTVPKLSAGGMSNHPKSCKLLQKVAPAAGKT